MFQIFASIAFACLAIRFYSLAVQIDWCFEKIIASVFVGLAVVSFFVFVIVDSVMFALIPIAFVLVAIDMLAAGCCSESVS